MKKYNLGKKLLLCMDFVVRGCELCTECATQNHSNMRRKYMAISMKIYLKTKLMTQMLYVR
jgi:hypothetical protein